MVATCVDAFGRLDLAVNNAGTTGTPGSVADYPTRRRGGATMAVNLDGVFFSLRAELAVMVPAGAAARS